MSVAVSNEAERKRRIRRNTLWLLALALAFYLGFIGLAIVRSHG
jgi:hypothetical protein